MKDIRRKTRKRYSSEEKIRIVLAGLRGEDSIAELCRQEGIAQGLYYSWSKKFLEAGKKRLAGDTAVEMNVRKPDFITAGADKIERDVGPADILVTSAGITHLPVPAEELTVEKCGANCRKSIYAAPGYPQ